MLLGEALDSTDTPTHSPKGITPITQSAEHTAPSLASTLIGLITLVILMELANGRTLVPEARTARVDEHVEHADLPENWADGRSENRKQRWQKGLRGEMLAVTKAHDLGVSDVYFDTTDGYDDGVDIGTTIEGRDVDVKTKYTHECGWLIHGDAVARKSDDDLLLLVELDAGGEKYRGKVVGAVSVRYLRDREDFFYDQGDDTDTPIRQVDWNSGGWLIPEDSVPEFMNEKLRELIFEPIAQKNTTDALGLG